MELVLTVERSDRLGILLTSYQFSDRPENKLHEKTAIPYSRHLLILFAKFKAYCSDPKAKAEDFLLDVKSHSETIEKFDALVRASKKSSHPFHPLLHDVPVNRSNPPPAAPSRNPSRSTKPLKIPATAAKSLIRFSKRTGIRFVPGILTGKDVRIVLDGRQLPLDDAENVEVFLKCLAMCSPENEGVFDSGGMRQGLDYSITFSDERPASLSENLSADNYRYFEAKLQFERLSLVGYEHFIVSLIHAETDIWQTIVKSAAHVVYREAFSVHSQQKQWLADNLDKASSAPSDEFQKHLSQVFHIKTVVNQTELTPTSIEKSLPEYRLRYSLPKSLQNKLKLRFSIEFTGFRSRDQFSYPIVISECTQGAKLFVDCSNTDIAEVGYFVGARTRVDAAGGRLTVVSNPTKKSFTLSATEQLLFPGEGAVAHWAPVQRVDRVLLVNLVAIPGIRVKSVNGAAKVSGTPSQEVLDVMYLVEDTAEKLRVVARKLREHDLGISVRRAYSSSSKRHNRGCSVDVTLVCLKDGRELPMPADALLRTGLKDIEHGDPRKNYFLLEGHMKDAGFWAPTDCEWWHFMDEAWRRHPVLDFDARIGQSDVFVAGVFEDFAEQTTTPSVSKKGRKKH